MNIINAIKYLYHWFRKTGHTTLLKRLDKSNDICVIVTKQSEKKEYKNAYTIDELKQGKLMGLIPKPVFIETNALIEIFELFEKEQNKLTSDLRLIKENKEKDLRDFTYFLHKQIDELNKYKNKLYDNIRT